MNNILIPTDFSENSIYAIEYASYLAKVKEVKLIILHITKNEAAVKKQLDEVNALPFLKDVNFEMVIRNGKSITKTINRVGIEFDIELIVMGSNGVSNVGELIMGGTTENVIRSSQFNVLTIKHKMLSLGIDTILFPSDFSKESYKVFETVKAFAETFNAKVHLLSVLTKEGESKADKRSKRMADFVKHFQLDGSRYENVMYQDKTRELGVLNYSIDNDMDMIAIGSHGKGIVRKLVKESISQDLVRNTFKPIMTVRF